MADSSVDDRQFGWTPSLPKATWFRTTGVLILALLLLLVAAFLFNLNLRQLRDSFGWVTHTDDVLLQAGDLQEALLNAGINARSYVLTGSDTTLAAYRGARVAVSTEENELLTLVPDNAAHMSDLMQLRPLIEERLQALDHMVELGPAHRQDVVALMRAPDYENSGAVIRAKLVAFRTAELDLLKFRQDRANYDATLSQALAIATAIIALGTGALGLYLLQKERTRHRIEQLQSDVMHVSRLNTMGQTAATLAHEINQPLAATSNYLNSLKRMMLMPVPMPPEKLADVLQKALAQVQRAGEIVRRLRNFVEKQDVERVAEQPWKLIAEAVSLLSTLDDSILLETRVSHDLPAIVVDKVQVQQVLVNLMRNAIEAMAQSPRRSLMLSAVMPDKDTLEISVQDTGPGLSKDVAARLFQPFTSTKKGGMGIGLSVCQTIVTGHGGRIWAEANPAGGTIFHFTLPMLEKRAAA